MHSASSEQEELKTTPLFGEHEILGARIVPFAGYKMPVQYPGGIIAEHLATRASAGLFDVSHMGQALLKGVDHATVAGFLETLIPADILTLKPGKQRYSQLLNADGGILDDLMVSRSADPGQDGTLTLVVNAATKEADFAHISAHLPAGITLERKESWALVALQGPKAEAVLADLGADVAAMGFMSVAVCTVGGIAARISRSGYTGEDGFELSVADGDVVALWRRLLADDRVRPVGLGARDSLRLEAGLCLYGHDIDTRTTPVEADLLWSIQKRRRESGGFPGAAVVQRQIRDGVERLRVGILPEGRVPARDGTEILAPDGTPLGVITSGGFGPSVNGPVAMGYIKKSHATPGAAVRLMVRGKPVEARVAAMPFVPHAYKR
ncbi:MAG: glycine cleavage system aminomethyltransferase GcvT [Methylobacteriaceae bacterium]|jgi:aminomethyltransferase|nr:glycine cleavage system aminomethyltransferase GcvT [Methylobacteriaceae bacterium]